MPLRKRPGGYSVSVKDGPRVCYQRHSVDVMFRSVAEGAGMLQMKQAGATTIAQDEATCVVFGMPREAIRLGAVDHGTTAAKHPRRHPFSYPCKASTCLKPSP